MTEADRALQKQTQAARKVALVTGAGSGIGRACARKLLASG
jgi:NAD(P)-dependent dehydrogenase (short-subunit alcohol dehydrogenase family)